MKFNEIANKLLTSADYHIIDDVNNDIRELVEIYEELRIQNEKYKECIIELIDSTEYGVNQWQKAWSPDKDTKAQKVLRKAKLLTKDEK